LATYYFSSFLDGDAVAFDPDADVFLFDNWFLSPGSVSVLSCRASVVLMAENRRVTLTGVTIEQLSASNVNFVAYNMTEPVSALAAVSGAGAAVASAGYEMSIA
jgi:hypothetical protein